MASLGWIDFSPTHRQRVGSVLDLLKPEGMVDELGLGTMRDALANELFPGISTIQTRARYFFIIPYILYDYQKLEPKKKRSKTAARFLEENEYETMWVLAERYNYREGCGVIGITKRRPSKIARRPSEIYWNGLYTYMFMDTGGLPAGIFLHQAKRPELETLIADTPVGDDSRDDADVEHENTFRIKASYMPGWKDDLTLDLTSHEAEFFRDRIKDLARDRLISEIFTNQDVRETFFEADSFMDFAKIAGNIGMNETVKQMIINAHDFSQLTYGAHLAYNCQLQNTVFGNKEYEAQFSRWAKNLKKAMIDYTNFNLENVFSLTKKHTSMPFVTEWWNQSQKGFPDLRKRDELIRDQEARVKGSKARLQWNKTDDVKEAHWIGLEFFNYRFPQAKTILNDIMEGLRG